MKQERQTTSHKDDKQNKRHTKTMKSQKKNEIDVKITYFNKMEIEKQVRGVILGLKLTIKHPSLVDEWEETRILVTAQKEKGEENKFWGKYVLFNAY